ncbi:MAG: hypothetical protein LBU99_03835 [Spirochaetaceae bacterium]|jgi:predicted RNase H-like nuclease (RuvC/YqgF family)|nr:hypothetical protein [Spirochaetaceae bacterium]
MDIRRRTIQELEIKRNDTLSALTRLYTAAGRKLLSAETRSAGSYSVGEDRLASYHEINRRRDDYSRIITDIQQSAARRKELQEQSQAVKKHIEELNAKWPEVLETLGSALYLHYQSSFTDFFGVFFTEISGEKTLLTEQQSRAAAIQKELESQGFFSKLVTQMKLVPVNASITQLTKKIGAIYIKGARAVRDADSLRPFYQDGTLDSGIIQADEQCNALRNEIEAQHEYLQSLIGEDAGYAAQLSAVGADNPTKRIEELRKYLKQYDSDMENLCTETGRIYINRFIDENGNPLGSEKPEADMQKHLSEELVPQEFFPDVMQKRKAIISYSRRIEILELTGYIEKTEKQISSLEGSVADDERKIRQLNDHIRDLKRNIEVSGAEKEGLIAKRAQLELLEGDTVKLLGR